MKGKELIKASSATRFFFLPAFFFFSYSQGGNPTERGAKHSFQEFLDSSEHKSFDRMQMT